MNMPSGRVALRAKELAIRGGAGSHTLAKSSRHMFTAKSVFAVAAERSLSASIAYGASISGRAPWIQPPVRIAGLDAFTTIDRSRASRYDRHNSWSRRSFPVRSGAIKCSQQRSRDDKERRGNSVGLVQHHHALLVIDNRTHTPPLLIAATLEIRSIINQLQLATATTRTR